MINMEIKRHLQPLCWVGFVYKQAVLTASSSPQGWFRSSRVCPGLSGMKALREKSSSHIRGSLWGENCSKRDGASKVHRDFYKGPEGKEERLKAGCVKCEERL